MCPRVCAWVLIAGALLLLLHMAWLVLLGDWSGTRIAIDSSLRLCEDEDGGDGDGDGDDDDERRRRTTVTGTRSVLGIGRRARDKTCGQWRRELLLLEFLRQGSSVVRRALVHTYRHTDRQSRQRVVTHATYYCSRILVVVVVSDGVSSSNPQSVTLSLPFSRPRPPSRHERKVGGARVQAFLRRRRAPCSRSNNH
ncbi:hypothetical protein LY76DRAFT_237285 [Colletotrichum caudatum]|nr:hypothetical protein LY76DRAFT_237285 [Colletotrichum caudatum]